jgi:K+-sensing histidine kinase KdpD
MDISNKNTANSIHHSQAELAQYHQQLEEKDKEIETLRAKVGLLRDWYHDIRTPLGPIIGVPRVLLHTELTDEQREHIVLLRDCGEQLLHMINAVIDFVDLETKDICLRKAPFELRKCLEFVVENARQKAPQPDTQVKCSFDDLVPQTIVHDEVQISKILYLLTVEALLVTGQKEATVFVTIEEPESLPINLVNLRFIISTPRMSLFPSNLREVQCFLQQNEEELHSYFRGMNLVKRLGDLLGGSMRMEIDDDNRVHFLFILPCEVVTDPHI